jgi:hypothetical protein
VNEHVFAAIVAYDEAEAFLAIEEFDDAGAFTDHLGRHAATAAAAGETAAAATAAEAATAARRAEAATTAAAEAITAAATAAEAVTATTEAAAILKATTEAALVAETVPFVPATTAAVATASSVETHALLIFPGSPHSNQKLRAGRRTQKSERENKSRHDSP